MRLPGVNALRDALAALSLDTRGHKDTLKRRLRNAEKAASSSTCVHAASHDDGLTRPENQDFDSYLVVDFEATCVRWEPAYGDSFGYPNEIIEFPVVLLQWRRDAPVACPLDGDNNDDASFSSASTSSSSSSARTPQDYDVLQSTSLESSWRLEVIDEYHRYIRPTWKPQLSEFCTELTGITQGQVDVATTFNRVLQDFEAFFCLQHGLFTQENATAWVTDGPWDLRDFVAKQCYISGIARPKWLGGKYIDLRNAATSYFLRNDPLPDGTSIRSPADRIASLAKRGIGTPNISAVLRALHLQPFEGRQHSGIDDARNIARILQELVNPKRDWRVSANARTRTREPKWAWMNAKGTIDWPPHGNRETKM